MSNSNDMSILENLDDFFEELNLEENKKIELSSYNTQLKEKIILKQNSLLGDEERCFENITSIINKMEKNKTNLLNVLEQQKQKNLYAIEEKNLEVREKYEKEIKGITIKFDELETNFVKTTDELQSTYYYKSLEILQTKKEYESYLLDIKRNYDEALLYFYEKKDEEDLLINIRINDSNKDLRKAFVKLEKKFNDQVNSTANDKFYELDNLKNEMASREKNLFQKKILINDEIDKISKKYNILSDIELSPIKNHIQYLEDELTNLKNELNENQIKLLDTFKLNLEIIDKQIDSHKLNIQEKIDANISSNIAISKINNESNDFLDEMRAKKIEYELTKSHDIDKLNIIFDYNKKDIEKNIELFNKIHSSIETIYNIRESIDIYKLRNELELQELKIQKDSNIMKHQSELLEQRDKVTNEYHNTLHKHQLELEDKANEYNENLLKSMKDNNNTVTSLEIEKNLILKNYNISRNKLLNDRADLLTSSLKHEEINVIQNHRLLKDFKNKLLSQDIQLANKKNDLMKLMLKFENDYLNQNLLNQNHYLIEVDTYSTFEKRYNVENNMSNSYFQYCIEIIESVETYFSRFNSSTNCSNENISFNIFKYLLEFLFEHIETVLLNYTKLITQRVGFEGTIKFQYELNHLMNEKNQNEILGENTIQNRQETIDNYTNTIKYYNDKIFELEKELDTVKNKFIRSDVQTFSFDIKILQNKQELNEIDILKNSVAEYEKEINGYKDSITRNKKLIDDLEKSIPELKRRFSKIDSTLSNKLTTLEKRHKQDSSIYTNFIDNIDELISSIKKNISFDDIKGDLYLFFSDLVSDMKVKILEFQKNDLTSLSYKLEERHNNLIDQSRNKYNQSIESNKEFYNSNIKQCTTVYNEEIYEIEKKVDKINSIFDLKKKENNVKYKEKSNNLNNELDSTKKQLHVIYKKLLYDLNTFDENIKDYKKNNENYIISLKNNIRELTEDFHGNFDKLRSEHEKKVSLIIRQRKDIEEGFNLNYTNLVKENITAFEKKEKIFKTRINKEFKNIKGVYSEHQNFFVNFNLLLNNDISRLTKKYKVK